MSVLTLQDVTFDYITKAGTVNALRHATASFEKGKLYAIVGRSGSGKSTLLSLMAGLLTPKSGEILYEGQSLSGMDRDRFRRENVGMIFQSYYLLPQLSAVENVEISLDLAKKSENKRERAREMLTKMGLSPVQFRKRSTEFSGGEQQRIAIARALAPDPSLILADEPTGNLDSETGKVIMSLLMDMAHEGGKCVILITHAMELAEMSDCILHMRDGVLTDRG